MNNSFPTDKCPLCGEKLELNVNKTTCHCTSVPLPFNYERNMPHYIVAVSSYDDNIRQCVIISPYFFDSQSRENTTAVYLLPFDDNQFMSLPMITDWSQPSKIIERIKTLIPFL